MKDLGANPSPEVMKIDDTRDSKLHAVVWLISAELIDLYELLPSWVFGENPTTLHFFKPSFERLIGVHGPKACRSAHVQDRGVALVQEALGRHFVNLASTLLPPLQNSLSINVWPVSEALGVGTLDG